MAAIVTKSYEQRLQAAIDKANAAPSDLRAAQILFEAMQKEIKLVNAITNMPGFRAWIDGERFDVSQVSNRKK